MNDVRWSPKALKQMTKLPSDVRSAVVSGVSGLKDFPNCQNVKKLTNHQYGYRLRVGNYRVFFDFNGAANVAYIEEVKKRDDRTY